LKSRFTVEGVLKVYSVPQGRLKIARQFIAGDMDGYIL